MLQLDTKYLLFLLLLPCWWLLQEAKVNEKPKWSSIMFRRNWMQLHPRCPGTHGSPCLPVLTPSRQRTSRKSAYSSRLIFSLLKIKTLVHSKLCFCSIVFVYCTCIYVQVQFSNWDTFICFSLASHHWCKVSCKLFLYAQKQYSKYDKNRVIVSLAYEVPGTDPKELQEYVQKLKR